MARKSEAQTPSYPLLRMGASVAVPDVLESLGADPAEVLAGVGFSRNTFADPDNLVTYTARGRMFQHCARATGCDHFGLLVGQHNHLHSLGLSGLLIKYSTTVEQGLTTLERYFYLHTGGAGVKLEVEGGIAVLSYQAYQKGIEGTDQVGAGAVATMFNILRELCGPDWKAMEVWFVHRTPEDVEPFHRYFATHLRFDAEKYAVVFSSSWLSRHVEEADPEVRRLIQNQIDRIALSSDDNNFPTQVRFVLRAALTSGEVTEEQLAGLFSMHPRTFSRRLEQHALGFRALIDETRYEMARQLLTTSGLQVNEIAEMLHYSDARSFIRAFRRWSGTTPARWRKAELDGVPQSKAS